jgi:hypothetical protein
MRQISIRKTVRWQRIRPAAAVIGAALLAVAIVGPAPAEADNIRVTHGDATSLFNAFGNGGWAILNHNPTQLGAPSDAQFRGSIRPFAGSRWDGRHFCELDWHVIVFEDGEDTKAQAEASSIDFVLDGAPLPSTRTVAKRFLADGAQPEVWGVADGAILPPEALAVGAHTLSVDATFFDGFQFASEIQFFIDPAGTGACL